MAEQPSQPEVSITPLNMTGSAEGVLDRLERMASRRDMVLSVCGELSKCGINGGGCPKLGDCGIRFFVQAAQP